MTGAGRGYVLLAAMVAAFVIPFSGSALNLAVPLLAQDFSLDSESANWIVAIYLLVSAIALVPIGRAADIYGRRIVFTIGMASFVLITVLCGFAPSARLLLILRGIQGLAGAAIFGTSTAILTSTYPPSERGRVLGLSVASTYTGLSVGPVAGGFLTQHFGWQGVFFASALIGVPAMFVVNRLRRFPDDRASESFDAPSAVVYVLGLAAVLHGFSSIRTLTYAPAIIGIGAILLLLFVLRQFREETPLVELRLFRNSVFALSNAAALIHYSATFASGYLVSLYLQLVKGLPPQRAGMILLVQPILMAVLSPLSGKLSDRVQPRVLASSGMGLTGLGLVLFVLLRFDTPVAMVMLNLALIGIGFALFSSPNTNAVMSSVGRTDYGIAASILGTMRMLGQATSMVLVNLAFAAGMSGAALVPQNAKPLLQSMKFAYVFFAVLCVLGIAASLSRGNVERSTHH